MQRIVGMLCATAAALSLSACGPGNLAEVWDGTSWTVPPTSNPADAGLGGAFLFGASCTSASACMAVGNYKIGNGNTGTYPPLSEQWDGTSWTALSTPSPAGSVTTTLNGVSCTSAKACTAVGNYYVTGGNTSTLAERWDGTSWTVQPTPNPAVATGSFLNGVSCTSATACTAVGYTGVTPAGGGNSYPGTLAERWDGTSWTVQPTPNPAGSTDTFLTGVSCTSASACTAVGQYMDSATNVAVSLAERWDGTSWTVQPTPNPAGSVGDWLGGVSCTSATACVAVGGYNTNAKSATDFQLAERWDGTSWTIQVTPQPQQESYLNGVSCTSDTACTAVGTNVSGSGDGPPLAEVWDGTNWTTQTAPNQEGSTSGHLNAVSCTLVSACAAVGHYN